MKKLFNYAMAAVLLFGLASCSTEVDKDTGFGNNGKSTMSFTVKTAKNTLVTYADDIAQGAEWDISDVSIYAFDENGDAIDTDDFTIAGVGTTAITITSDDDWMEAHKGEKVNFYFVANDEAANLFGETSHVDGTIVTEADFIEQLTATQTVTIDAAEHLTAPLLFSASASVTVPAIGKTNVPIKLKRREARFDIINPNHANFAIDKVIIKNANIEGYIFAAAKGTKLVEKANLEEITVIPAYDADGLAESVFYMYPTVLGAGNTEIVVLATVAGTQKPYPVNSTSKIEANKRYKLVLDPATFVFSVVAEDYDDADEDLTILPMESMTMTSLDITDGTADYDNINNLIYIEQGAAASEFEVTVFASSTDGVDVTFQNTYGTGASLLSTVSNDTDAVITYSTVGYKTVVKIKINQYDGTDSFSAKVTIADKQNPAASVSFAVMHDSGETVIDGETGKEMMMYPTEAGFIPAVKVGSLWWAPVNVGATKVNSGILDIDSMGYYFQWGRSTGFDINYRTTILGPISTDSEATANHIILTLNEAPYDWLIPQNDNLWSERGVCPKGWMLPSLDDYITIKSIIQNSFIKDLDNNIGALIDDDILYFPLTGYISPTSNEVREIGLSTNLWTKDVYDIKEYKTSGNSAISIREGLWINESGKRATPLSVRCVKDVQ